MRKKISLRSLKFMLALPFAAMAFSSACNDKSVDENLGKDENNITCDIGQGQCGANDGLCYYQMDPTKGLLECESNVLVTACLDGFYCDPQNFPGGCIAAGPMPLACDMGNNKLVQDVCGNSLIGPGEACDDGANNGVLGQPCDAQCKLVSCGNGIVEQGEDCDNGATNGLAGDLCSDMCKDVNCGNGVKEQGEQCDHGAMNGTVGDTCSSACLNVSCGNNIQEQGEQCDHGPSNGTVGDTCNAACQTVACGNGTVEAGEACDNGVNNGTLNNPCNTLCKWVSCGNGTLEAPEQCDHGVAANGSVGDTCDDNCMWVPNCGDSIVELGEQCDDGANNGTVGSMCDSTCHFVSCGNGIQEQGEACDDGALNGTLGDACTINCTLACVNGVQGKTCAQIVAGDYGCNPIGLFCLASGLVCQCPDAGGVGTFLPPNSACTNLCWQGGGGTTTSTTTTGAGGAGGSGGAGGAGGAGGTTTVTTTATTTTTTSTGSGGGNPSDVTITFTPDAGLMPDAGAVTVEGADDSVPWGTLCTMTPNGGSFDCTISGLSGATNFYFIVKFPKAGAIGGFCYTFITSDDVPCGGNGSNLGTVVVTQNAVNIPYSMSWNGTCQNGGPPPCTHYYFNGFTASIP